MELQEQAFEHGNNGPAVEYERARTTLGQILAGTDILSPDEAKKKLDQVEALISELSGEAKALFEDDDEMVAAVQSLRAQSQATLH